MKEATMDRSTTRAPRRKRAKNGMAKPKTRLKNGRVYLEFSHPVPRWALEKFPQVALPKVLTKTVTPDRETDGVAWQARIHKEIEMGTWVPDCVKEQAERVESITFKEYATQWLDGRITAEGKPLRPGPRKDYEDCLNLYLLPFFGAMPMMAISANVVKDWYERFQTVRKGANRESRRAHVYKRFKAIMASAATEPWHADGAPLLKYNPTAALRVATPERAHEVVRPTEEQFSALLSHMPDWAAMVLMVMRNTAMREGEALGLRAGDIDFDAKVIHVRRSIARKRRDDGHYETVVNPPKTKSSDADVVAPAILLDALRDWIDHRRPRADEPLFLNARGEQPHGQNLRNVFNRAKMRVPGLECMNAEDLRPDFLSSVAEAGGSVADVMKMGRHKDIRVASIYQHPDVSRRHELAEKVSRRGPSASAGASPVSASGPQAVQESAADDGMVAALADVLEALDVGERVDRLRGLGKTARQQVLAAMGDDARMETTMALLED